MSLRVRAGVALIVVVAAIAAVRAEQQPLRISAFQGERFEDGGVSFGPDAAPYYAGARPRAGIWLDWVHGRAGKMPDGQVVVGFDFYAWQEADALKVVILAKIAKDGLPATPRTRQADVKDGTGAVRRVSVTEPPDNVQSVEFSRYTLRAGDVRTVDEMKALGIKPITLQVSPPSDDETRPAPR